MIIKRSCVARNGYIAVNIPYGNVDTHTYFHTRPHGETKNNATIRTSNRVDEISTGTYAISHGRTHLCYEMTPGSHKYRDAKVAIELMRFLRIRPQFRVENTSLLRKNTRFSPVP